ncbi:MAG TPA: ATP-binding cassette domain-containing protein [Chthoniobacterales bacterium]
MNAASDPLLRMTGINKAFNGVPALREAGLEVRPAEVHALIGQNGAGKSTLIKVLTGYYRRDQGQVTFNGQSFEAASPQAAQNAGISTIYQEINLVSYRSVTENICLGRERRRMGLLDWKAMHQEAERVLAAFKVKVDVRQPLSNYSTALQQMVAIARAVGFQSKLVIMDEPTSSLDDHEVAILFDVIRHLKASGVSVIFVSHKLDELYAVCDRVTVMRDGRTVLSDELARVSKLDLVTTMIGRKLESAGAEQTAFRRRAHHEASSREAPLLAVRELAVGRRVAQASVEVRSGEVVGVAGLLGAGRSEVARAIFGADLLDKGEMTFKGQPYAPMTPGDAIASGIGFCSEDRKIDGIVPDMSVRENLTLALLPHLTRAGVIDVARQQEVVKNFVERLGVKCAHLDQPIRELSGGNQQKVLLARWLCLNPQLLILDEPTRGIDVGAKAEIQALVGALAADGLGVLMISSEIEEVIEGSDRVYVMREGRTVASLHRREITEDAIMNAMADGSAALHPVGGTSAPVPAEASSRRPATGAAQQAEGKVNGAAVHRDVKEVSTARPAILEGQPPPATLTRRSRAPRDLQTALRRYGTLTALFLLLAFNFAFTPHFANWQTLNVNLTQVCNIVIVGVGMTLVIATGGIDLSVGSLMAIAGALAPLLFLNRLFTVPLPVGLALAFIVPVAMTSLLGYFNGWLITRFRIQPIVGTLILFIAGRGLAQVLTNGNLQVFSMPGFQFIGLARPLGIPFQAILMVLLVVAGHFLLQRSIFGRQILAVGGNDEAARLAGIPVMRVKRLVYLLSGFGAGIAGLIVISINSSSDANLVGLGMELDAIAAVAVGGTLLTGGSATVLGTLLGALIIQLVRYTLLANGVPDSAALVVKGAMIVGAVFLQQKGRAR